MERSDRESPEPRRRRRLGRLVQRFWVVFSGTWLAGCLIPAARVPMSAEAWGKSETRVERVILLLPGRGDRVGTFRKQRFYAIARDFLSRHPATQIVATDAHMGYYRNRQVIDRLRADVVASFQAERKTLVGISLGGLGSVMFARRVPDEIDSIYLMAPFLGDDDFLARVERGKLEPREGDGDLEKELVEVWRFLLQDRSTRGVDVRVGCGSDDRFADAVRLLERRGTGIQVDWVPGGHRWPVWRELWTAWLGREEARTGAVER